VFDLVATPMHASFVASGEAPNLATYEAMEPAQSIYEASKELGELRGPQHRAQREAALASMRMRFDIPDAAPRIG
jgi:hypothetical protein